MKSKNGISNHMSKSIGNKMKDRQIEIPAKNKMKLRTKNPMILIIIFITSAERIF
jgi:hypothetical protein